MKISGSIINASCELIGLTTYDNSKGIKVVSIIDLSREDYRDDYIEVHNMRLKCKNNLSYRIYHCLYIHQKLEVLCQLGMQCI